MEEKVCRRGDLPHSPAGFAFADNSSHALGAGSQSALARLHLAPHFLLIGCPIASYSDGVKKSHEFAVFWHYLVAGWE